MAAAAGEAKFSVKYMINKEKTKVLSAEVKNDLADVLLSFLSLPLGTIVRLLQKHYGDQAPLFGSLNTLYNSLANLDNVHFWTEAGKLMLLNPRSSFEDQCRKLKLNIDDTKPSKYFMCRNVNCYLQRYLKFSMYYDTAKCPHCGKTMNREVRKNESKTRAAAGGDEVFTIKTASFLISDDLRMVVPEVAGSLLQTLSVLGITDIDGAEQRTIILGFDAIMDLLKCSLMSPTPLTDLLLQRRHTNTPTIKFEPPVHHNENEENSNPGKMILKLMLKKTTNKFLFAEAGDDFVDFIFSFLTIPLGGIEWLLSGKSSVKSIDNLYSSSANLIKYLKTQATGNSLFEPKLAPLYLSRNQIFPLDERETPKLNPHDPKDALVPYVLRMRLAGQVASVDVSDPRGQGSYVREPGIYIVADDLTVTPVCLSSSLSIISGMKIQFSDIKELEIHIGLEEGLSIMKASLTSTCALSNALSSILMKQPK